MAFRVLLSEKARKQLRKFDKHTHSFIVGWLKRNIEGCINPRQHGKALTGNRSGQWRYRVGDYRILADIQDDVVIVLVLEVGQAQAKSLKSDML